LRAVARAAALLAVAGSAYSQSTTLAPVTVTGKVWPPAADVTGFGDVPLKDVPISASVIDHKQIEDSGARRLADLTRFDPSLTDSYDAPGYWDIVSIRGYTLDNVYNFRREGLPINTETSIPLDNKERVELLKGTSGIQAGTSAPGGLVNYVVKRPTDEDLREVRFEWTQRSSFLGAADLGGRFGNDKAFGYRINVADERLRPLMHNLDGSRQLLSVAGDWRIDRNSLLEAEVEWSRKKQPSQVGFSLLGNALPGVPDPRLNLNNQPWVPPTKFDALTGTLRYTRTLAGDWKIMGQLGSQHLKNDDYTAFPFGCSAEGVYDRYCTDGTFDYYDYRSIGEKRRENAANLELKGKVVAGGMTHNLAFGILRSTIHNRLPDYAYRWVGTGNVDGTAVVFSDADYAFADPTQVYAGTRRDETSTELSVRDAIRINDRASVWLGARHTRLDRSSVANDGSGATNYSQSLTTPWTAVSYKLSPATTAYTSWGQGVESQVVPNNGDVYVNAGSVLPALKSRQWELGLKGAREGFAWQLAWFDIRRPVTNIDYCNLTFATDCIGQFDGTEAHRGIEAAAQWAAGAWRFGATAMLLHARREGSAADPANNGRRPVNVPSNVLRAFAAWKVPGVAGLELQGSMSHEGDRAVLADNSIMLPAWTRLDAALRYETQMGRTTATWTLGVDNVTDKRYWRESPYQFGHVYLYPGAPRTVRMGVSFAL
jgi:iron complex outermembrane receptor protein